MTRHDDAEETWAEVLGAAAAALLCLVAIFALLVMLSPPVQP